MARVVQVSSTSKMGASCATIKQRSSKSHRSPTQPKRQRHTPSVQQPATHDSLGGADCRRLPAAQLPLPAGGPCGVRGMATTTSVESASAAVG
eukprot:6266985-Prymnesium_polylepis.1